MIDKNVEFDSNDDSPAFLNKDENSKISENEFEEQIKKSNDETHKVE